MAMKYISLFSGVEAATLAWEPLGWEALAFCEIDAFPSAVLAERWPDVPNLGDITKVDWGEVVERVGRPDVVVGGSPCQSFSIAGGRESLSGESRLMFEYIRAVNDIRSEWIVWENVPGVLSARDDAFWQLLSSLQNCGYVDLCWRVLDAQFARVPVRDGNGAIAGWVGPVAQRRRRVFLVGHLGTGGCSTAVLFEPESLRGDSPSSREKRKALTAESARSVGTTGVGGVTAFVQNQRDEVREFGGDGQTVGAVTSSKWAKGQTYVAVDETHVKAFSIQGGGQTCNYDEGANGVNEDICFTLNTRDKHAVAFPQSETIGIYNDTTPKFENDLSPTLRIGGDGGSNLSVMHSAGFKWHQGSDSGNIGYEDEQSPTLTAGWHQPAVMASGQANAEICEEGAVPTLTLLHEAPIVISATGGEVVGPLCARDHKGVGSEYVEEGKVICQKKTTNA